MPLLGGSYSLAHIHAMPAASGLTPDARMFTRNPIYWNPLLPFIRVKTLDKADTLYTFDPFNPSGGTTKRVIYASVSLSLDDHSSFEIQIDDNAGTLNTDELTFPNRVIISLGKTENNLFTHLSGMIREVGYTRGCEDNSIYNISGFGTGIRLNERILDVLLDEPKTSDGSTIDTTDPDFAANKVVDDALDRASYYPRGIYSNEVEGTGGFEYINSSGGTVDSDIKDFIPGVVMRFGEIQDLYNQIENYTGARIYVDESDKIQLQPIKTPLTTNSGFKITTNPQLDSDFADETLYVDSGQDYTWRDTISKDAGYSNSIFGLLAATNAPDVDSSDATQFYQNKDVEIAMRFKPITNPHWRLYAGVEFVGADNTAAENTVRTRWRICADDNGAPQNVGGIIANRYMYANQEYNTADGGLQVINIMGTGNTDLHENNWYWLILSSVNATGTVYWRWYYDTEIDGTTATAAPNTSTSTDGGTGWTLTGGRGMILFQGRFKTEPYNALDILSVRKRILIESVVPSFPQQITTKTGAVKYLCGLLHYQARPRRFYSFPSVTIPNKPMFPGDTVCIIDDRYNFSTSGNRIVSGQVTDINYSFGVKNGGSSPASKGDTNMSLSVVGHPGYY